MSKPLNVLVVEDSSDDVLLLMRYLKRSGYEPAYEMVGTAEDMRAALARRRWDVVLSDYNMPRFSAPEALRVLRESGQDVPFIVVSGSVGEETAVEVMRSGAHDYVMKDSLLRLGPAIEREMQEAAVRNERRRAQDDLRSAYSRMEALNERLLNAMRETHHRVKNNLQIIIAMIDMQAMEHRTDAQVPLEVLSRLGMHIRTLAVVHDLLTHHVREVEDQQRLSAKTVLETLLPLLQVTVDTHEIRYRIAEADLLSKQCTVLALVTNELVSNAIKHASGPIVVTFSTADSVASLLVEDGGPGFPAGFDAHTCANMGLELVTALVATDLEGTLTFENRKEGGARVRVTFVVPPQQGREEP